MAPDATPGKAGRPCLWTWFKQRFGGAGNQSRAFRLDSPLVGKTLDPRTATRYGKQLELTGTGKILGVRNLSERELCRIGKHVIAPLELTPARGDTFRRTPGECIIDTLAAVRIGGADSRILWSLDAMLRATWLDGALSPQAASNALALVRAKVGHLRELAERIERIEASMESELHVAHRNDNFYGRLFETHLAEYLVAHPDPDMLAVRDRVSEFLLADLRSGDEATARATLFSVLRQMRQDPAAWSTDIPPVRAFREDPTVETLAAMLEYKAHKSVTLLLSLAVQYAIASPRIKASIVREATEFYRAVILPQRKLVERGTEDLHSDMHGLLFAYQRGAHPTGATASGNGIRPMDLYVGPDPEAGITAHDWSALCSERTVGKGMSGSANIVDHLLRAIAKDDAAFPMAAGHIATAAWLAHAGGHSFNEAYSVFGYGQNKQFRPISFRALAVTSPTSFAAIDHAFESVLSEAGKLARLERPGGKLGRRPR